MSTTNPTHYICFETFTVKAFADLAKPVKQKKQSAPVSYQLRIVINGDVEYYTFSQDLTEIAEEYNNAQDEEKYILIAKMKEGVNIEEFELSETLPNKRAETKKQAFVSLLK